jgi:hypothetical protein
MKRASEFDANARVDPEHLGLFEAADPFDLNTSRCLRWGF